jgi:hypothetical protein
VLPESARFVRELPSGMRFYTVSTSAGLLCLANAYPPGGNAKGGFSCGESLSESHPITIVSEQVGPDDPRDNYGLAMDGITAVSFAAGGTDTTVPVTDNLWAYEGEADLDSVTVHWSDGTTQTVTSGR